MGVQLHGGIRTTGEHPAHPDLKLAKADQLAYDTARAHDAARAGPMDLEAGGQR